MFNDLINLVAAAITVFGSLWIVWGAVTLGVGIKDKTGPEVKQGFGTLVGGALIVAAAAYLTTVTM